MARSSRAEARHSTATAQNSDGALGQGADGKAKHSVAKARLRKGEAGHC